MDYINYIETKAKCRHLKNRPVEGLCGRCLSLWSPLPLPKGFCLEWSSNFVDDSGQIQSVRLLQNVVSNRTQNTPPPPSHTLSVYTLIRGRGRGERVEPERRLEFTKLARKYQHDWLYLQSINSDKHLPQSSFTGLFFRWRHFALVSI